MDNGCTIAGLRLKRRGHYEHLMQLAAARAARRLVRMARAVVR